MVVDPGCMKCLDCVSVCPKDALYVGAGTPAILARERTHGSKPADEARAPGADAALHWLLLIAFTFATLWEFEGFTGDFNVQLCAWLTGIAVAAAALFRGKARRKREYTLVEEVLLAGFFLLALLAFRGWKGLVPFLFSLGLSAILAYLAVQALRLAYANNVGIQRWRLRASGHWTRGGVAFLAAMAPVGWVWFDAGYAHHRAAADRQEARASFDAGVKSAMENRFDAAIASFERALALDPSYLEARENLAGMLCAAGRYKEGIAQYEQALAVHPDDADTHVLMARAFAEMHDLGAAQSHLERALELAPNRADVHMMLSQVCAARGDARGAETHAARAKELDPSIAR
jgi:tetratricopeptide (TPR) repeat protein